MNGYRTMLEKEVIELWRTYRFAITCSLFAVLGIGLSVIVRYLGAITRLFGEVDPELHIGRTGVPDLVEAFIRIVWLLGPITAVLLAMGSIAGERQARTLALVVAKPISRAVILWAKFAALAMTLGVATALAALGTWLYTAILFEPMDITVWLQVWLLAWLTTLVYVAITLAASASAPSPAGAAAIGLTAFGAVTLLSSVVTLNSWLPSGLGEVAKALVLGELGSDVDPFRTVAASIALGAVALGIAWLRFRRLDL